MIAHRTSTTYRYAGERGQAAHIKNICVRCVHPNRNLRITYDNRKSLNTRLGSDERVCR